MHSCMCLHISGTTEGPQYRAIEKDGKVTWYRRYGRNATIMALNDCYMYTLCYSDDSGPQKFSIEIVGDEISLPCSHTWYMNTGMI